MFKKLRNKFLILNLIIISIMMLFAFTSIYFITYKNVRADIDMELRKISETNKKLNDKPKDQRPNFYNSDSQHDVGSREFPERSVSFTILTDSSGNITNYFSILDIDNEFYISAKESALSEKTNTGTFEIDDTNWAFLKLVQPDGYKIVFLDITYRHAILTNLIYTFIIVALFMLIIIFFISKFFANKAIKPIKDAFDKQKQFVADASHELKTPLAVINTNVDVLLSNGEDSVSNHSKWLYYIKSETERMTKLTNDLLYLTQMDYSDIKMIFSDFNLSESVENVILTMEAIIFENDTLLHYDIEPNLTIYGNSEQIKQVVMILLDNAVKYANNKGSIDISLKKRNNNIVLSVTNTGKGISEEHIGKIFDRFYRTDKSRARNSGGYGLGLAIAKAIIEQHKGKISAKSKVNENTTFSVELPGASS